MNWNLEGSLIEGVYLGDIPVSGIVTESRVAYGARIKHTVELSHGFHRERGNIGREQGEVVILEDHEVTMLEGLPYHSLQKRYGKVSIDGLPYIQEA